MKYPNAIPFLVGCLAVFCSPLRADYTTFTNVSYGTDALQKMDIYQPASYSPMPLIVTIHGGAGVSGDKNSLSGLAPFWADNNYVVANVNYRLASASGNNYPTDINDVDSAINYLIAHASTYNIDTTKIISFGTSHGGYLTLEQGQLHDVKIKACIVFYGANDLAGPVFLANTYNGETNAQLMAVYLGATLSANPLLYFDASPVGHITKNFPPTIFFHGEDDTTIPVQQSIMLHHYLQDLGVPTRIVIVPHAGHGFLTQPSTDSTTYQQAALDFLHKLGL